MGFGEDDDDDMQVQHRGTRESRPVDVEEVSEDEDEFLEELPATQIGAYEAVNLVEEECEQDDIVDHLTPSLGRGMARANGGTGGSSMLA